MKSYSLINKISLLLSICLIPFVGVQAGDIGLSEGENKSCNDFLDDFSCNVNLSNKSIIQNSDAECSVDVPLSCKDYLDTVNIKFDIDTEDGATFEYYEKQNEETGKIEVGYRSCGPACEIVFAGKCKGGKADECQPPVSDCQYYKGHLFTSSEWRYGGYNLKTNYTGSLVDSSNVYKLENEAEELNKELRELNNLFKECKGIADKIGLREGGNKYQYCSYSTAVIKSKYCKANGGAAGTVCNNNFSYLANLKQLQNFLKDIKRFNPESNVVNFDDMDSLKAARDVACANARQQAVDVCGATWNKNNTNISGCKTSNSYPAECKTLCSGYGSYQDMCRGDGDLKSYATNLTNYLKYGSTKTALDEIGFDASDFANQNIAELQLAKCAAMVEDFDNRCDLDGIKETMKAKEARLEEIGRDIFNDKNKDRSTLSCLNETIETLKKRCGTGGYGDDCIAVGLTTKFFGTMYVRNNDGYVINYGYHAATGRENNTSDHGVCYTTEFDSHSGIDGRDDICLNGYFFFDDQCNPVSEEQVKEVCGTTDMAVSFSTSFAWSCPISLIFEKDYDLNSEVVFSRFNLDLSNQSNTWYAWKASEKAPLLVYDPNNTGEVKDATQLFGNWAFGGKQVASLGNGSEKANGKWENGFEALGSLDRDFDGQLSGDELSDLALWFDVNRDGISQKGEVKTLKEVGVIALYFNGYKIDVNGDLRLDIGYSRDINGKTEQGAAIDWYEVGAPTKVELAEYYSARNGNESTSTMELKPIVSDGENIARKSQYSGVWNWFIDEGDITDDSPSKGMFILSAFGENEISGYTITEKFFAKSPNSKLNSFVTMNRVRGLEEDGKLLFSAQIGNSFTDNQATLDKDGKTINGKTTVVVGGNKTITYSWKAVRD